MIKFFIFLAAFVGVVGLLSVGLFFFFRVLLANPTWEIEKDVLRSIPKYSNSSNWKLTITEGSFPDSGPSAVIKFESNDFKEVFDYYEDYLTGHGWQKEGAEDFSLVHENNGYTKSYTDVYRKTIDSHKSSVSIEKVLPISPEAAKQVWPYIINVGAE